MMQRKTINTIYAIFLLLTWPILADGQQQIKSESKLDDTQISILTCGSGDELYSTFGHVAIRIYNKDNDIDQVYNYGMFDFKTPNFYIKFMRGLLPYSIGSSSYSRFLQGYHHEKRSVIEQVLNLDVREKKHIIEYLKNNMKKENRKYKYDFFLDNCSTRLLDLFNNLPGDLSFSSKLKPLTFRDLLKENLHSLRWEDFGIDLVIGARSDRLTTRRHQMFLPSYLKENIEAATFETSDNSRLFAQPSNIVLDFEELAKNRNTSSPNIPLYVMIGLLLLTIIVNIKNSKFQKFYNKSLLFIAGILGLFLLFMWFGTAHDATKDNWNVLWLCPLWLVLPFVKNTFKTYLIYFLFVLLFIAGVNSVFQFLPQFFNFTFLPLILSISISGWIEYCSNKY
ncbi:MAG: DUF4105 domain-containing protein [Saprospiraceae bacterium]